MDPRVTCLQSITVMKFWMVIKGFGEGSGTSVKRHSTLVEAEEEAGRLCRKTGETFLVLEAVEVVEAMTPPVSFRRI